MLDPSGSAASSLVRGSEDPKDPYFTRVCFVCREKSKDGSLLATHYGGMACLSCRAFFRRAHQSANAAGVSGPQFMCKKDGLCSVTTENRRRCQACRYSRCLKAGMIPSAVMTEDQVKTRFKKMFDKKSKGGTPHNEAAAACLSRNSDEADMPSLDRRQSVPVVNYSTYQGEIRSRLLKKAKRLRQPSDTMATDEARSPPPRNPVNNISFHGKQNWSSHKVAPPSPFLRLDGGSGGAQTRLKDEISTAEAASGSGYWGNDAPTFMRPATANFDLHSFNPITNRNPSKKIRNEAPMPNDMMKSLGYFHSQQSVESAMPQHPSLSSYLMNRHGIDSALESQQQLWMNQQTSDLFDKMREAELHQKAMFRKHSFEGYNPGCFSKKSLDDKVPKLKNLQQDGGYNYNSYTAPKGSLPTAKKECFTIDHSPKKRQLRNYEQSKSKEAVLQDEDDDLHCSLNSVKRRMTESTSEEHDEEMANVAGNQTEPALVESIKQEEVNKQMAELKPEDFNGRVEQNKLIKEESSSDNNSEGESFGSSWETSSDNSFSNGMDSLDSDTSFQSETTSNNSLEKLWAKIGSVKHDETYEMDLKKAYYKQVSDHNELQKTLKLACMQTYFDPEAVEAITTFHKRTTSLTPPLNQTHFFSIMLSLSKRFSHFALLQRQFGNLTKKDQRFILSRNCGRYTQLVLGMYLNAPTAQDQVAYLLGMASQPSWEGERVKLSELDEATQMFTESSEVYKLQALHKELDMLQICPAVMPYLALIVLYTYSPSYEGNLDNKNEVLRLNQEARLMLFSFLSVSQQELEQPGQKKVKLANHWVLDEFLMLLDKCALFFAHKFRWPGGKSLQQASSGLKSGQMKKQIIQSSGKSPADDLYSTSSAFHLRVMMPYTSEEDKWLKNKIFALDQAYASVSIGEEIFSEYVKLSLDEPATPRFLMNLHRAFLERTWRILESHSVFRALPVDTKCRIWSQNTNKASALFICRGEMSSSFVSMQHIVGDLDNKTFMEEYRPLLVRQQLNKVSLFDTMHKDVKNQFNPRITNEYKRLILAVAPLALEEMSLKSVCILKLMTPPNEWFKDPSSMTHAEAKFMTVYHKMSVLLKRRVMWEMFLSSGRLDDAAMMQAVENKYNTFVENLEKIDRITDIVSSILPTNRDC